MSIIYDMETGNIESEQPPEEIARNPADAGPDKALHAALQPVAPPDTTVAPHAPPIHFIRALLKRL